MPSTKTVCFFFLFWSVLQSYAPDLCVNAKCNYLNSVIIICRTRRLSNAQTLVLICIKKISPFEMKAQNEMKFFLNSNENFKTCESHVVTNRCYCWFLLLYRSMLRIYSNSFGFPFKLIWLNLSAQWTIWAFMIWII